MNIQELLKEATKGTLSEENLKKIQEAIESKSEEIATEKHKLQLEAALAKQDTEYADMLEKLLEDIDTDHCEKMEHLVEAITTKHYGMLSELITKYKTEYLKETTKFKDQMVDKVDKFLDIVVENQIPQKELNEAVENTKAKILVEKIGELIGIDKLKQNKMVKEGLTEAKTEIDSLREQVNELKKQNQKMITEKTDARRRELLAEKTEGLPKVKKQYIQKVLGNKSIDFIKENFDYTLALYDEEETDTTKILKEEATKKTKTISENVDRVENVVEESVQKPKADDPMSGYLEELRTI